MIQGDRASHLILVCRVGSHLCALPMQHVIETMRPLPIEEIAGLPPFVLGLSIIRGAPLPVIDVDCLLSCAEGTQPRERNELPFTRFVTVKTGERQIALAVRTETDTPSIRPSTLLSFVNPECDESRNALGPMRGLSIAFVRKRRRRFLRSVRFASRSNAARRF